MKKLLTLIIALVVLLSFPSFASMQVTANYWKLTAGTIQPNVASWTETLPYLGGSGIQSVCATNVGLLSITGCPSSGGGSAFPFTPTTNFGAATNATTSPLWLQGSLQASSTIFGTTASTTGDVQFNTKGYVQDFFGPTDTSPQGNVELNCQLQGNYCFDAIKINNGGSTYDAQLGLDITDTIAGIPNYLILKNITGSATCLGIQDGGATCLSDYNNLSSLLDTISPAYSSSGTESGMTTTLQQQNGNDAVDYGLQNYPGSFATGIDAYQNYYSSTYAQALPEPHFSFWEQGNGNTSEASTSWGFFGATTTISGANATTTSVDIGDLGNTTQFDALMNPANATFNVLSSSTKTTAFTVAKNAGGILTTDFQVSNTGVASTSALTISNTPNCSGSSALTTSSSGVVSCGTISVGVTAVTGTWPIISSGGATPNLTFGGLSTTTNLTQGQLPYVTGVNTFGQVATTSVTCTGSASCSSFTVIGSSPITINATGGGASTDFSYLSNYGVINAATSSAIWAQSGINASSTSNLVNVNEINATSTALDVTGNITIGTANGAIPASMPANSLIANGGASFGSNTWITGSARGLFFNAVNTFAPGIERDASNNLDFIGTSNNTVSWTYLNGSGLWGIGSSSPYARLSVQANPTDFALPTTLFAIGSSTQSATTTLFSISNIGTINGTDSATTYTGIVSPVNRLTLATGTTTSWTATTSVPYTATTIAPFAGTVKTAQCATNTSFLGVDIFIGSTHLSYFVASTTVGLITFTSNNTFTNGQTINMNAGTTTTSGASSISCTLNVIQTT